VLTQEQIDRFRTFGFIVLPAALDGEALGGLIEEVDTAIAAAGPRDTEGGGITGHYVPAGDRPMSAGLVRRFQPAAEQLLEREAFPAAAHEILLFAEAWWHVDLGPDVPALKVAVYLETLDTRNGALRVLPTTHRIPQAQLAALHQMNPHHVPCHVIESRPGDAIFFHLHLWHAALNGRDRRQWSVEYVAFPKGDRERAELRQLAPRARVERAGTPRGCAAGRRKSARHASQPSARALGKPSLSPSMSVSTCCRRRRQVATPPRLDQPGRSSRRRSTRGCSRPGSSTRGRYTNPSTSASRSSPLTRSSRSAGAGVARERYADDPGSTDRRDPTDHA
jgi:Phytanoyl-CoA dioxygenase (PhyH)